jgi:hypothetical protein
VQLAYIEIGGCNRDNIKVEKTECTGKGTKQIQLHIWHSCTFKNVQLV